MIKVNTQHDERGFKVTVPHQVEVLITLTEDGRPQVNITADINPLVVFVDGSLVVNRL